MKRDLCTTFNVIQVWITNHHVVAM